MSANVSIALRRGAWQAAERSVGGRQEDARLLAGLIERLPSLGQIAARRDASAILNESCRHGWSRVASWDERFASAGSAIWCSSIHGTALAPTFRATCTSTPISASTTAAR